MFFFQSYAIENLIKLHNMKFSCRPKRKFTKCLMIQLLLLNIQPNIVYQSKSVKYNVVSNTMLAFLNFTDTMEFSFWLFFGDFWALTFGEDIRSEKLNIWPQLNIRSTTKMNLILNINLAISKCTVVIIGKWFGFTHIQQVTFEFWISTQHF